MRLSRRKPFASLEQLALICCVVDHDVIFFINGRVAPTLAAISDMLTNRGAPDRCTAILYIYGVAGLFWNPTGDEASGLRG